MPNNIKISEMAPAEELNTTDLLMVSQQDTEVETEYDSKSTSVAQLAGKIATGVQFTSELDTDSKTITGAINEAAAVGKISEYYHKAVLTPNSYDSWVDSETAVDGHTVYKSDGDTYEEISGDDLATWTIAGYEDVTFYIKQDGADTSKAYTVLGKPNTEIDLADSSSYQASYQNQVLSDYTSYKFNNLNGETNTFQILYHTDPLKPTGTVTVNLNEGQFVDTGTTIDGHTVYMSDVGSYQVPYGESKCRINFEGVSSFKIYYKVNTDRYNYIYIGELDTPLYGDYDTRTWGNEDYYYTHFTCSKNESHFLEIAYYKGNSLDSKDDRIYFYIVLEGDPHTTRGYVYAVPGQIVPSTYRGEVFNDYENNFALGQYSHAEGNATQATGNVSHAEGYNTKAQQYTAHAEGYNTIANQSAHAEGEGTQALGSSSHTEGHNTRTVQEYSHAEGESSLAYGYASHAEGTSEARGGRSHAEGYNTKAYGNHAHAEGTRTLAGSETRSGQKSEAAHAEGIDTQALNWAAHAEGRDTIASGTYAHAEGNYTQATNSPSHAEGYYTLASGWASHAEGHGHDGDTLNIASGTGSHTEGYVTQASGDGSHAEGYGYTNSSLGSGPVLASGYGAHAEGTKTTASGNFSHAEGVSNEATMVGAHAEGNSTHATGMFSHAEGFYTVASGQGAHAEGHPSGGGTTTASGNGSHAEGSGNTASGDYSHAEGTRNFAYSESGHVEGSGNRLYGHEGHIEGSGNNGTEYSSHTEGAGNTNIAKNAHMEGGGNRNVSMSTISHTEGAGNTNYGAQSHIEGGGNTVSGNESHVEGGGNVVHGLKSHVEGGGNGGYGIGAHVEGKHNTAFGYAQHAEGAYNIVGYSSTPQQFDYNNDYAEGDIVCINNAYYGIPSSETDMPFIFRCITAPGKIQSGNGVTIIHPSEWSSSTTYSQGDVVKVSGYGFYKANSSSVTSNPVIKHSDNGGNDWTKIKEVLSPFKTTSSSGYYLLDCRDVYGSNDIAIVDSGAEVSAMWEPISTSLVTHVEGLKNIATGNYQHVQGKYNNPDPDQAFIIGNGSYAEGVTTRSNAMTVDWNGDMVLAGDITPGTSLNTTATTIGGAINEIVARIPAPPTVDGTYTLSVTVSNGVPTYSWV